MTNAIRSLLIGACIVVAIGVAYIWFWPASVPAPARTSAPVVLAGGSSTSAPTQPAFASAHVPDGTELLRAFDGTNDGPYLIDNQSRPWELQVIASSSRYLLVKIPQHTEPGDVYGVYDVDAKRATSALGAGPYAVTAGAVTYFVTGDAVLIYRAGDSGISTIEKSHNLGDNETYQRSTTLYTTPSIRSFDERGITLDVFDQTSTIDGDTSPPNTYVRTVHIDAPAANPTCASQGGCFQ